MIQQNELQEIKMAWLAAEEAGDHQAQLALLRDYPDARASLIDFIAAYRAAAPTELEAGMLPMTRRALAVALERAFVPQAPAVLVANAADLRELRSLRGLSLAGAASGLRLGVDVWKKFEDGLIELRSLSARQLERLAHHFQISGEQFGQLLLNSRPVMTINRRQTAQAARKSQQGARQQTFAEAIARSAMPAEERQGWLEDTENADGA